MVELICGRRLVLNHTGDATPHQNLSSPRRWAEAIEPLPKRRSNVGGNFEFGPV